MSDTLFLTAQTLRVTFPSMIATSVCRNFAASADALTFAELRESISDSYEFSALEIFFASVMVFESVPKVLNIDFAKFKASSKA